MARHERSGTTLLLIPGHIVLICLSALLFFLEDFKTNVSYILSKEVYYSIFAHFSMLKANSDMYSIAFSIEKNRKFLGV